MRRAKSIAAIPSFALASASTPALVDEGGISFWLSRTFGSPAAVRQQPGWSMALTYYHTSVTAGDIAHARETTIGNIPANATTTFKCASIIATVDLGLFTTSYVFESPILGGQASIGLTSIYAGWARSHDVG